MTVDVATLLASIPAGHRSALVDRFNEIVENFRLEKWEPSELNGGKLCEVVYSIIRGHADGRYPPRPSKPGDMVKACRDLEKETSLPRSLRIQIPRMIVALYEFRNNRNVGHVGGDVDPNHMDALCVLTTSRWMVAELIRVFHNLATEDATAAVDALVERDLLTIWQVGARLRVLDTKLSTRDQLLVLLYRMTKPTPVRALADWLDYSNVSRLRTDVLKRLHRERMVELDLDIDTAQISPKGVDYVTTVLKPK